MPVAALITWIITVFGGLFLLAIWLIEYDPDFQRAAATRLPVPIISGHALLALGGLGVWVAYLITDNDMLAWITLGDLALVVSLGVTMAIRWFAVYRGRVLPAQARTPVSVGAGAAAAGSELWHGTSGGDRRPAAAVVPPERHFPLPVVIGHGIFALITVTLVLLTTVGGITS